MHKINAGWVWAIAVTPDGTQIVSCGEDKTAVWDLASGRLERTIEENGFAWRVAVTPDGSRIVSGGGLFGAGDHPVKVWDLASGRLEHTLKGHTNHVWAVAVTPDSSQIVSGGEDGTVRVWGPCAATLIPPFRLRGPLRQWPGRLPLGCDT